MPPATKRGRAGVKDLWETWRGGVAPIHPAGWPFVIGGALAAVLGYWLWTPLGNLLALATAWMAYFFRDPERTTPLRPGVVVSAADGRVQAIERVAPPAELAMGAAPRTRVSVFLNVFDVHVQRAPADGTVAAAEYRPGKFLNAALDKASEDNERMSLRFALAGGGDLAVVQIAGLVARRIVCDAKPGDALLAGARYGLIRFGSRVDVYLPEGAIPLVAVGQRAIAGETVLAEPGRPAVPP
jgi:phosphatidylserine decarboxylase